jgi:hypothetical protein
VLLAMEFQPMLAWMPVVMLTDPVVSWQVTHGHFDQGCNIWQDQINLLEEGPRLEQFQLMLWMSIVLAGATVVLVFLSPLILAIIGILVLEIVLLSLFPPLAANPITCFEQSVCLCEHNISLIPSISYPFPHNGMYIRQSNPYSTPSQLNTESPALLFNIMV